MFSQHPNTKHQKIKIMYIFREHTKIREKGHEERWKSREREREREKPRHRNEGMIESGRWGEGEWMEKEGRTTTAEVIKK